MVDIGDDKEEITYLKWVIEERIKRLYPSRELFSLKNILKRINQNGKQKGN